MRKTTIPLQTRHQIPSASGVVLKVELPPRPQLQSMPIFSVGFPKMAPLNAKTVPRTPAVEDLSRVLDIPKRELYRSIGQAEHPMRTAFFNRLEKLFRRSTKLSNMLQTIRKQYE